MNATYTIKTARENDIKMHLSKCKDSFIPSLDVRLDISEYAKKIFEKSLTFESWIEGHLIGLLAVYLNKHPNNYVFITNVSVLNEYIGRGIASNLLKMCIEYAQINNFKEIFLEVYALNIAAISLYKKFDFYSNVTKGNIMQMKRQTVFRNYNEELKDTVPHKYAYKFDFDVMHPYMLKSFIPFFRKGNLLELGSFKGDFTKRLLTHFDDITCLDASDEALAAAKKEVGDQVKFIHALFESVALPEKYDNIVLTHVLEHLDDPIFVMKRINDEWLSETGRFFLVCPNANAPSRQIAVKMGLITHNSAVTPAEKEHGHRRTYSLDTLERDAVAAGLNVVHRSGIFFKSLSNFQWDRLLDTDIISPEYLEGCYHLGQQYPDLCSSIFLMCEKGGNE